MIGSDSSFWGGQTFLFDNGILLRLESAGRGGGYFWTFGLFVAPSGTALRPAYPEVQRWLGQHRSSHARAYLTARKMDALTRSTLEGIAGRLGSKYISLMLMERKPELIAGPEDARWSIDLRILTRGRVGDTAAALGLALDSVRDALTMCAAGIFAAKMHGA